MLGFGEGRSWRWSYREVADSDRNWQQEANDLITYLIEDAPQP